MKSIRSRTLILFSLCLSAVGTFGFLTFNSFQNYKRLLHEHAVSYEIADRAVALQSKPSDKDERAQLLAMAEKVTPEFRSKAARDFAENGRTSDLQFLFRAESEFRRYNTPLIEYFEKRTVYFGAIALAASLFFIMGLSLFVLNMVFSPLRDLSAKMSDFIDNRYSYEFTMPEMNEVGQLHAKFNTMAQKVLSQIEELQSLDKAKSEFLSIASHELRTPLTSIKGSLSLLNSGVTGDMNQTAKNLMTIALDETDRLIRLINELLDLAKIEARQFPLQCEWQWTQSLVKKTFDGLAGLCSAADVKLRFVQSQDLDLYIDADRIQQVLTNLLSNAIKYSPKGEAVTVELIIDESQHLRVEVQDRGRGISPEDQEIIFEKFRQATNSQNPLVKGTGLGLAIAKALVEQHGGTIGVKSKPGDGSTFYFTVPKWRLHEQPVREVAS